MLYNCPTHICCTIHRLRVMYKKIKKNIFGHPLTPLPDALVCMVENWNFSFSIHT